MDGTAVAAGGVVDFGTAVAAEEEEDRARSFPEMRREGALERGGKGGERKGRRDEEVREWTLEERRARPRARPRVVGRVELERKES